MNALEALIQELEQDRSLAEPRRMRERLDALDRVEAHLLGAQGAHGDIESPKARQLRDRAGALCAKLERVNRKVCQAIRREIQRGGTPDWLLEQMTICSRAMDAPGQFLEEGYDYRDVVTSEVLQFEEPDAGIAELAQEMVFYQPTPARHVFDLLGRAALTDRDVLVDLGSGLGHVPLLAAVCTNARCIGIEREAAYVDCARLCAQALKLSNVTFTTQDARDADFSRGTLFYLYTPFTGTILRSVLDALRREAARRDIRIGTYGPCTSVVAAEPWLHVIGVRQAGWTVLFRSGAIGARN